MQSPAWDIVAILYWLSLSTWFGGVVFVAVVAPLIMRTVRESNPILTNVLSVNLEGQHGTLLGGSIVGRIINVLTRIELGCAAALLLCTIVQFALLRPNGMELIGPLVRLALYLAAVAVLVYDYRVVWPRMWKYRQEYIDHADEPDIANPALDQLNRYQGEGANLLFMRVGILLALILFSATLRPPGRSGPTYILTPETPSGS
jgi:hypothetical protein